MAIGPFIQYTPPYALPTAIVWSFGSGSVPTWAELEIRDFCMANVGRMCRARAVKWLRRYFVRQDEDVRKRAEKSGLSHVKISFDGVHFDDEMMSIRWYDTTRRIVEMPRSMFVPSTLTLLTVHDC